MSLSVDRKRLLWLSLILAVCCLLSACIAIWLLYRAALVEAKQDLKVMARSQTRLVEEIVLHDQRYELAIRDEFPGYEAARASLGLLAAAHSRFDGLGEHGEYVLARREGEKIVFLFRHRQNGVEIPHSLPLDSPLAEPMKRALAGDSGVMRGLDYEGNEVLAAYEPILLLDIGLVVKRSLSEVREPFYRAGLIALFLTLLLVSAGVLIFRRITGPMFERLENYALELSEQVEAHRRSERLIEEQDEVLHQLAEVSPDVFWVMDLLSAEPQLIFVSRAFEDIWQLSRQKVLADPMLWSTLILESQRSGVLESYAGFLAGKGEFDVEFSISRTDGSLRHVWAKGELIRRSGKPARAVGIAHDVTRLKEAQLQSESERDRLQRDFECQKLELQRVIDLMSGREVRMAELKREIEELRAQQAKEKAE